MTFPVQLWGQTSHADIQAVGCLTQAEIPWKPVASKLIYSAGQLIYQCKTNKL